MINKEMGLLGQMGPLGRKMLVAEVAEVAEVPKRQKARSSVDDRAYQLAELTRLELATFAVTGRCSNQLRYNSRFCQMSFSNDAH